MEGSISCRKKEDLCQHRNAYRFAQNPTHPSPAHESRIDIESLGVTGTARPDTSPTPFGLTGHQ